MALCRFRCHRAFDDGHLDLLPHLEPRYRRELADALEHLGRTIEVEPRTREWARDDSDFDSIGEDPRFPR